MFFTVVGFSITITLSEHEKTVPIMRKQTTHTLQFDAYMQQTGALLHWSLHGTCMVRERRVDDAQSQAWRPRYFLAKPANDQMCVAPRVCTLNQMCWIIPCLKRLGMGEWWSAVQATPAAGSVIFITVQNLYHAANLMFLWGAANCGQGFKKIFLGLRIGCGIVKTNYLREI